MKRKSKPLLRELYDLGMIKTWYRDKPEGWKLVSGLWSPVYINLRSLPSYPEIFKEIALGLGELVKESGVNRIVGIATAGIPIASAVGYEYAIPVLYTRKLEGVRNLEKLERKISEYGAHRLVEGVMENYDNIGLVDDLITRADSKLVARYQVLYEAEKRGVKISCEKVFVILDREQGGKELLKDYGIELYALVYFRENLKDLEEVMNEKEFEIINDYLENPEKYQTKNVQEKLKKIAKNDYEN